MLNFLRKQMKWVMAVIVVAFLLSTFLMYEGRSTRRSPSVNADGTMSDYEVAKINGRSFMRSELEQRLRNYLSTLSTRNVASLDMPAIYQTVLDQAVLESQLVKEIDEQGIRVSDADADQAMKIYADTYYPTRETFYQALANSGIKVEDYKRNLARQIAVDQLMTNAIGQIEISEDRALEFYDSMKNLFYTQPEGFMVHMADFRTSEDAEAFRNRLVAGESWDVIASQDKLDTSETVNITQAPVFLPASALRVGMLSVLASRDVAEPSEVFTVSSSDFAVGMKISRVDQTTRPYSEVSADIRTLLTQEEQRKRLSDYEESLKTKAQVVINDEQLFARQEAPEVEAEDKEEQEIVVNLDELMQNQEKADEESQESQPEAKEESKSEEPESETVEVKAEETKSEESEVKIEESETPAPVEEEKKSESESEEKEPEAPIAEPEPEIKDEAKEEAKVEAGESESKPELEVKESEEVKQEESKIEEAKTEEPEAVEEVKAPEVSEAEPEAKEPETESQVKSEESVTESETQATEKPVIESVNEAANELTEQAKDEIKNEVNEVIEAVIESLDSVSPKLPDIE